MKTLNILEQWVELLALFFLVVGLLVSILTGTPQLVYVVVLLSGFLAGRTLYIKKLSEPIFPFVLIVLAFIFGYTIGAFTASRKIVMLLFFGALLVSYYLHKKKFITIFKSKDFLK
jgi:hypothetical protein